jgi:hypothetical protein
MSSIGSTPQAAGDMSAPTSRSMQCCAWGLEATVDRGPVLRRLTAIEGASHEIRAYAGPAQWRSAFEIVLGVLTLGPGEPR